MTGSSRGAMHALRQEGWRWRKRFCRSGVGARLHRWPGGSKGVSRFMWTRTGMADRDDHQMGINTRLAHAGNDPRDFFGFVQPPVVHASTVLFPDAATMAARAQRY